MLFYSINRQLRTLHITFRSNLVVSISVNSTAQSNCSFIFFWGIERTNRMQKKVLNPSPHSALLKRQTRNFYKLIDDSLPLLNRAANISALEKNYLLKKRVISYLRQNMFDAAKIWKASVESSSFHPYRMFSPTVKQGLAAQPISQMQDHDCSEQIAAEMARLDEYADIWKYSFLTLASLVGIFTIVSIICLVWRIVR